MSSAVAQDYNMNVLSTNFFPDDDRQEVISTRMTANSPNFPSDLMFQDREAENHGPESNQKNATAHRSKKRKVSSRFIPKKGSKPITVDAIDDVSKKRGRPRVNPSDVSATERRRTQIRLAQRAYRLRKDAAITSLSERVRDLESTIEQMNKSFLAFNNEAMDSRALCAHPRLMQQLRSTTKLFISLTMKHHGDDENIVDAEKPIDSSSQAPLPSHHYNARSPSSYSRSKDQTQITQGVANNPNGEVPALTVSEVNMPHTINDNNNITTTLDSSYPLFPATRNHDFGFGDMSGNAIGAGIGAFADTHVVSPSLHVPQIFNSQTRFTYSFQETTFARRLQRRSLEYGYAMLRDPATNPERLNEKFKLTFGIATRSRLIRTFASLIQKKAGEPLEVWSKPFFYIGRAGMHYPRKDEYGNAIFPPNMHPPEKALGPLPFHLAEKPHNFKSVDEVVDAVGFGGDWFDCNDVEGYLHEKGIHLTNRSSFVEIPSNIFQSQDKSPVLSSEYSSCDTDSCSIIATPCSASSTLHKTQIGATVCHQSPHQPTVIPQSLYPYHDGACDHTIECLGINTGSAMGGDTQKITQVGLNQNRNVSPLYNKRPAIMDVEKFITKLVSYGVCLGRAAGFRQVDVDAAVLYSICDPGS